MKILRLAAIASVSSVLCFGANKDMIELQREVAQLQDAMTTIQRTLDEKFGALTVLMQQSQANTAKTNETMSNLQDALSGGVEKSLAPVNNLNNKVDSLSEDIRGLRDSLNDLNSRLDRMDAKITDVKNQLQIMQNPPTVPGQSQEPTGQPGAAPGPQGQSNPQTPPPGMSAEKTYTDARRDLSTGNTDLARQEFQQFLTYYPNTEWAPSAQYYLGEIAYNKGDYPGAIQAFDAVLERYPANQRTPDAQYMKGMALLKAGQRTRAAQEFRDLAQTYPHTEDARKALQQLRQMNATASVHKRPAATK